MIWWVLGTLAFWLVVSAVGGRLMDRWTYKSEGRLYGRRGGPLLPSDQAQHHARNAEIWRGGGGMWP